MFLRTKFRVQYKLVIKRNYTMAKNDHNVLTPPVNSSVNFLIVSSCLTTFLFLALTLQALASCSIVGDFSGSLLLLEHFHERKEIGMCLPCHFL